MSETFFPTAQVSPTSDDASFVFAEAFDEEPSSFQSRTEPERGHRFIVACEGVGWLLPCRDVQGFREAMLAVFDPALPPPQRLLLVGADATAASWIDAWSEDVECVRRTLTIVRCHDGAEVSAVVTLSAHGYGIDTSLAVESVRADGDEDEIVRSGVHPIADLRDLLARYDREGQGSPSWLE